MYLFTSVGIRISISFEMKNIYFLFLKGKIPRDDKSINTADTDISFSPFLVFFCTWDKLELFALVL